MSRHGACVAVWALAAGLFASPTVGHATGHEAASEAQGCWYGASTGLWMVTPSVVNGSAFAAPLFITEAALLASPVVQFAAATGVVALSFCYAGQAVAPLYTHFTSPNPVSQ